LTVIQSSTGVETPSELGDYPRARDLRPRRLFGQLCSFQGPARGRTAQMASPLGPSTGIRRREAGSRPVSQNSTACVRQKSAFANARSTC